MKIVDKVIFLDIDGVLNNCKWADKYWHVIRGLSTDMSKEDCEGLTDLTDPVATNILFDILEKTGAYIVLSSSWRRWSIQETLQEFATTRHILFRKLVPYIVGVTARYQGPRKPRGEEIQDFIYSVNNNTIDKDKYIDKDVSFVENFKYVIIDDDSDMLKDQSFVQTNYFEGLTTEDANKVIEILGTK